MKNLFIRLAIIGSIAVAAISTSQAFFSDTETSTENVLSAGSVDLQIDNTSYYNGQPNSGTSWALDNLPGHLFFDFDDLKPSDFGEDTISLHTQNDSWACMNITMTKNDDNTCTEPEQLDDLTCDEPDADDEDGELAGLLEFAFWADDGDNVYEVGEAIFKSGLANTLFDGATWPLADADGSIWPTPGPLPANQTRYIGKYWCFGTLTQAPVAQGANDPTVNSGFTCDGAALDNASQTDVVLADIQFNAVQSRNNANFRCLPNTTPSPSPTGSVTPTVTPSPTPLACVETWASSVASNNQALRKNGSAVLAIHSDPNQALVAESTGASSDSPVTEGTFFSLGFGGSLVVGFSSPFHNKPGNDLSVFEVTGGIYPDELMDVEVSSSSIGPWTLIGNNVVRDQSLDMILPTAQFVKVTDQSNSAFFEDTANGFDLDGVRALCAQSDN